MQAGNVTAKLRRSALWMSAVLPVALFYGLLKRFSTGLPVEDDYDAILGFALTWVKTPYWARYGLFLSNQHNEYKPFLQNALVVLQLGVFHHISLAPWIWVGNLLVLGCLVPLWLNCAPGKPFENRLLLFVPMIWIFVSLNYAETLNFALCGMQEVPVVFFCLVTIHLAVRREVIKNWFGCVCSFLAYVSYANAFLMAPMGLVFFRKREKRTLLLAWCLSFLLVLFAFLYHYHPVPHQRGTLKQYVLFALTMAGAGLAHRRLSPSVVPVVLGIAMLAVLAFAAVQRLDRKNAFAFWTAVLMFSSCALASYGRSGGGVYLALAPRYRIYSDLAVAALYLLMVTYVDHTPWLLRRRRLLYVSALSCSIVYGLLSDEVGYHILQNRQRDQIYGVEHYLSSGGTESPLVYPSVPANTPERISADTRARDVLTETLRAGVYRLPAPF